MTDIAKLSLNFSSTGAAKVNKELDNVAVKSGKAEVATKKLNQAQGDVTKSSRISGHAFRNMSMQLSQVAQQGSATGNYLQAFAIQLPDLALGLGPVGILLGAVAGGLASYVFSAKDAAAATEPFIDRIEALGMSYSDLSDEMKAYLRLEQQRKNAAIDEEIASMTRQLEKYRRLLKNIATDPDFARLGNAEEEAKQKVTELSAEIQILGFRQKENNRVYDETVDGTKEAREEAERLRTEVESMVTAAEDQAIAIGKSSKELAIFKATQAGANETQLLAISLAYEDIEAEERRKEAIKAAAEAKRIADQEALQREQELQKAREKLNPGQAEFDRYTQEIIKIDNFNIAAAEKEAMREEAYRQHQERLAAIGKEGNDKIADDAIDWAEKIAENQKTIEKMSIDSLASAAGALSGFLEEGTVEWAAAVMAQRGIMAAQAVMAANLAATLALANPAVGVAPLAVQAQAETIRTIGYLNAGLILAQGVGEIAGARAMGGQVQAGSSYLVGEQGPEVVTMGTSGFVTPNHRLGGGGQIGNMVVNINNAPPGSYVEQKQDNQGNQIAEVFIADMANGGRMSKSMQGTFGLKRQGR